MIVNAKNTLLLQGGVVRASMLSRSTYAPRDAELELGKKDDDHKFKPRRHLPWVPRWRRKRVLAALLGLLIVTLLMHALRGPAGAKKTQPSAFTYIKPRPATTSDVREPTGAPPGLRTPHAGDPTPQSFSGPFKFYNLASSLRAASHASYHAQTHSVLFALASPRSATALIPMLCAMAGRGTVAVHAALVGRFDMPLSVFLAVNGVDEGCAAVWHDARPDYAAWSSESRAGASVQAAVGHVWTFLKPRVVLVDGGDEEFLAQGVGNATAVLGVPLITVPDGRGDDWMWVSRLDVQALASWHVPSVEVVVRVPAAEARVLYLLRSLAQAQYAGLGYPRLTLELPADVDAGVVRALEAFQWPPLPLHADRKSYDDDKGSGLTLRRLTTPHPDDDNLVAAASLFYPATPHTHVLVLSPTARLAPMWFHYAKYALLSQHYSADAQDEVVGVSLADVVDTDRLTNTTSEAKAVSAIQTTSPATLFFSPAWRSWHDFLRLHYHAAAHPSTTSTPAVTEPLMQRFLRARPGFIVAPALERGAVVAFAGAGSRARSDVNLLASSQRLHDVLADVEGELKLRLYDGKAVGESDVDGVARGYREGFRAEGGCKALERGDGEGGWRDVFCFEGEGG